MSCATVVCNCRVQLSCATVVCNCRVQLSCTVVVYSCRVQLSCTIVVYNCRVQLSCTIVVYNCRVQLSCTIVVYNCLVQLSCTTVLCNCRVQLSCATVVCNCRVQLKCTIEVYNWSVQLKCTIEVYNWSVQLKCTAGPGIAVVLFIVQEDCAWPIDQTVPLCDWWRRGNGGKSIRPQRVHGAREWRTIILKWTHRGSQSVLEPHARKYCVCKVRAVRCGVYMLDNCFLGSPRRTIINTDKNEAKTTGQHNPSRVVDFGPQKMGRRHVVLGEHQRFKEMLIQGQRTKVLPSVGFARSKHGPAVPTQCAPALRERHRYEPVQSQMSPARDQGGGRRSEDELERDPGLLRPRPRDCRHERGGGRDTWRRCSTFREASANDWVLALVSIGSPAGKHVWLATHSDSVLRQGWRWRRKKISTWRTLRVSWRYGIVPLGTPCCTYQYHVSCSLDEIRGQIVLNVPLVTCSVQGETPSPRLWPQAVETRWVGKRQGKQADEASFCFARFACLLACLSDVFL